jgi:hypothetical protein
VSRSALGDYLRATERLSPADEEARRGIARLLGLRVPDAAAERTPARSRPEPSPAIHPPSATAASAQTREPRPESAPDPSPSAKPAAAETGYVRAPATATVPSTLAPAGRAPVVLPPWLPEVEALALPSAGPAPHRPVPDSLLDPRRARAILFDSLSTRVADGPIDVERLVRARAAGHPLPTIPRHSRATLSHGVQVLVDRGEGMLPFLDDVRQLLAQVRAVAGAERVEELHFEGSPLRGAGRGGRWCWRPYEAQLPAPGTVVLAVTDLGLGGGRVRRGAGRPGEWAALARRLRRHGCPLRALVPYPRDRWPAGLRREMGIVPWDRDTGARLVHRLLGELRRRGAA